MKKICLILTAAILLAGCGKKEEKKEDITPTPETTAEVMPTPEATPEPEESAEPTPSAYATMTPEATAEPTPEATPTPTPAPTASPDPAYTEGSVGWVEVKVDGLNVRASAGTDGKVVGNTQNGSKLHVFAAPVKNGGYTWYKISKDKDEWIADKDGGWLTYHAYAASPTPTPASQTAVTVTPISGDPVASEGVKGWVAVKVDHLNIRSAPSTEGKLLGEVKNGSKYYVYAEPVSAGGYTWYKVGKADEAWIADSGSWVTYTKFN